MDFNCLTRSILSLACATFVFIGFCTSQVKCQNDTSDEESSSNDDIPMAVITIGILVFAFLIGILVAKLFEYLNTRKSIRDDASDMSEYTRNVLKMQFMYAFNKKGAEKLGTSIDIAKRYAKMWRAKAAAIRAKALKAEAKAKSMWGKKSPLASPRGKDAPATIHEEDEIEAPSGVKKGNAKTTADVNGTTKAAASSGAPQSSKSKPGSLRIKANNSKPTVTSQHSIIPPINTKNSTTVSTSPVTVLSNGKTGSTITPTAVVDGTAVSATNISGTTTKPTIKKSSPATNKSDTVESKHAEFETGLEGLRNDHSILPLASVKKRDKGSIDNRNECKSPVSSSGDYEFLAPDLKTKTEQSETPDPIDTPASVSAVKVDEKKSDVSSTSPRRRPESRAKSAGGNKKTSSSRPLSGAVTPGLRPKSAAKRPVSGKGGKVVKGGTSKRK